MNLHTIIDNNQLMFQDDNHKTLASLTFVLENNIYKITHTNVNEILQGQGIASKLMQEFYDYANKQDKKIEPICSYAVRWFEKNIDKQDILIK